MIIICGTFGFADILDRVNDKVVHKLISYTQAIDRTLTSKKTRNKFVELFNDDDFYYTNNKTCLKVKVGVHYHEYKEDEFIQKLRLKLDLPLLKHSFRLFVDGDYQDKEINPNYKERTSIGIESEFAKNFDSKLRFGLRGFDELYLRYRIGIIKQYGQVFVEPYQYFRYSHNQEFTESSNLNIDRAIGSSDLLRLYVYRASGSIADEKSYGVSLSYWIYLNSSKNRSWTMAISRELISKENIPTYNRYLVSSHWKQNLFKKYFYVDINPYILYENSNDYHASVGIKMLFEWRFQK